MTSSGPQGQEYLPESSPLTLVVNPSPQSSMLNTETYEAVGRPGSILGIVNDGRGSLTFATHRWPALSGSRVSRVQVLEYQQQSEQGPMVG